MHEGHRQRMLERLQNHAESLQDYELLEILLFNAIPRKNTNEIAHNLLTAFGTIGGVFRADTEALLGVEGVGESTAAYLRCIGLFYDRVKFGESRQPTLYTSGSFGAYLAERYRGLTEEVMELYCLDANGRIKYTKRFTSGEADRVRIPPEEVSRAILSAHPYGIVLAHNHTGDVCTPSHEDDRFTAQIQMLCSMNNIRLYDHIIANGKEYYSYFLTGRMEEIRNNFNVESIIGKGLS